MHTLAGLLYRGSEPYHKQEAAVGGMILSRSSKRTIHIHLQLACQARANFMQAILQVNVLNIWLDIFSSQGIDFLLTQAVQPLGPISNPKNVEGNVIIPGSCKGK